MDVAPIRLFFVDDHPIVAAGLAQRYAAKPGFVVVGTASTVDEALAHPAKNDGPVDVYVLDVHLERMLTPRDVQRCCVRARVVLFSAEPNAPVVASLLRAGAAVVLDKGAALTDLDGILHDVVAGRTPAPPTPTVVVPVADTLSRREREVFVALARCQTPKEAAADLGIATSTIYCHIDRIRQKLGVSTLSEIVALAVSERPGR